MLISDITWKQVISRGHAQSYGGNLRAPGVERLLVGAAGGCDQVRQGSTEIRFGDVGAGGYIRG
jgi:hypothetical protein